MISTADDRCVPVPLASARLSFVLGMPGFMSYREWRHAVATGDVE